MTVIGNGRLVGNESGVGSSDILDLDRGPVYRRRCKASLAVYRLYTPETLKRTIGYLECGYIE